MFNSHLQDFQFNIYNVFVVASYPISIVSLLLLVPEVDLPEAILVVKQTVTAVQATWPSLRMSFLRAYEYSILLLYRAAKVLKYLGVRRY